MIQAILTDLDGVIRYWDPNHFHVAEDTYGLPRGSLAKTAFAPELLLPAITGRWSDEVWRARIAAQLRRELGDDVAVDAAVRAWSASAGEVVGPVLDLFRRCRFHLPLVLVTNATSRLSADLSTLGLLGEFDYVINSSAVGVAKPNAAIFAAALDAVRVHAENALFIDDTSANVAAAAQLGFHAHHFQEVATLEAWLKEYELL